MVDDGFRLFPVRASSMAGEVDAVLFFLILISTVAMVGIATAIVFLAFKYRRGSKADRRPSGHSSIWLEATWIGIPFVFMMAIFVWGAAVYFRMFDPPDGALEVHVVGKQWMWKFQHPDGRREINELHVPLGQPVRLDMISQDVIHSLFVPAFRVKHDVLPGRQTQLWFEATRPGEYHLFCAEYCGTQHSLMKGRVIVLEPAEYQAWLAGSTPGQTPIEGGAKLFEELRCGTCHRSVGGQPPRCPPLEGLFGTTVTLADGSTVVADEAYIRESILRPNAKIVKGYPSAMPPFEGQIGEEGMNDLIAYLKSLAAPKKPETETKP
jgi:cytochrome c oxidase subunit II